MDGAAGTRGNRFAGTLEEAAATTRHISEKDGRDIFVRAHTSSRTRNPRDHRWSRKWPRYCLIFDTETTLDSVQTLNFGSYRRCKLAGDKYLCVEEGIFTEMTFHKARLSSWSDTNLTQGLQRQLSYFLPGRFFV